MDSNLNRSSNVTKNRDKKDGRANYSNFYRNPNKKRQDQDATKPAQGSSQSQNKNGSGLPQNQDKNFQISKIHTLINNDSKFRGDGKQNNFFGGSNFISVPEQNNEKTKQASVQSKLIKTEINNRNNKIVQSSSQKKIILKNNSAPQHQLRNQFSTNANAKPNMKTLSEIVQKKTKKQAGCPTVSVLARPTTAIQQATQQSEVRNIMKTIEKTKVIVRRLPPTMSEKEFLEHVEPLAEHNYFCFFEADKSLGQYAFSRAYINFLRGEDVTQFCERFDNYVFLDSHGHEYPAVVEHAPCQKVPTVGLFVVSDQAPQEQNIKMKLSDPSKIDQNEEGHKNQNDEDHKDQNDKQCLQTFSVA